MQSLPPKDPLLAEGEHRVPQYAPTRIRSPTRKRRRRSRWWIPGAVILGGLLLLTLSSSFSHGHGHRVIRVTGRIVWVGTGEPVVGARVLTVSRFDLDAEWDPESAWFIVEAIDAERAEMSEAGYEEDLWCAVGLYDNAGTRSGGDGRIDLLVGLPSTTYFSTLFTRTDVDDPEEEVSALWIAPEGWDPVIVRLALGHFERHDRDEDPPVSGTYDLGTVVVPVGEPAPR